MIFQIVIGRSVRLFIYFIVLHVVMLTTLVSLLGWSWWSMLTVIMLVMSLLIYCYRYQGWGTKHSVTHLERDANGDWYLGYGDQHNSKKRSLEGSYVCQQGIILYFKGGTRWQNDTVIVAADSVDVELFRQLSVYCRDPKTFCQ